MPPVTPSASGGVVRGDFVGVFKFIARSPQPPHLFPSDIPAILVILHVHQVLGYRFILALAVILNGQVHV